MAGRDDYVEREQAWVKHWMLEEYLKRLILKVCRHHWTRFVYIDGYAGPWRSQSENLSDTSFGRALAVMRDCQSRLAQDGINIQMHAVFFEKNRLRAARLQRYAEENSSSGLTIQAHCADFMDHIGEVASQLREKDFSFALIDPKGYSEMAPENLAPLLRKRGVEVLINLMYDFINRAWGNEQVKVLDKIFGDDRQDKAIDWDRERDIARMYLQRLREVAGEAGGRLRAASFPVQHRTRDRTHYFLVYATHSPIGLLTFDAVAAATWHEQALTRATTKVRERAGPQMDMLSEVHDVKEVRPVDRGCIRAAWLSLFPEVGAQVTVSDDLMAQLLERCGPCFYGDLQEELKLLVRSGVIENVSISYEQLKRRKKNVVHDREVLRRLR